MGNKFLALRKSEVAKVALDRAGIPGFLADRGIGKLERLYEWRGDNKNGGYLEMSYTHYINSPLVNGPPLWEQGIRLSHEGAERSDRSGRKR